MTGRSMRPRVAITWVVVALALLALPTLQRSLGFPIYNLIFLYLVFFWVTQSTSWNILSGYSGYFSFAQGGFYGAGLYATAILGARYGWGLLPTLPVAALVGAGIAAVTGLIVFRLRRISGEIFALFSLVVALGVGALANNWSAIDGGRGIPVGQLDYPSWLGPPTEMLYYLGVVIALGVVFLAYVIQHSRFGAGLFAIRDDEKVAEAIGVPTLRYKLGIFTLNGAIAGLSAGLHAVQVNFISNASAFNLRVPVFVILMSVIGGRRLWFGPVLGAILITTLNDRMAGGGLAELSQIVLGAVLIAATLFLRGGIAGRLRERPAPAVIAFLAVTVGAAVVTDMTVISAAFAGMLVALLILFIPERAFRRFGARSGGEGGSSARREPAPEPQETGR